MAVIPLEWVPVRTCPNTIRFSVAQALTRCRAPRPLARSWQPRSVFPSMATTSPWASWLTGCTHWVKQAANRSGSSIPNTRPKVSWDGMPLGSFRNRSNHSRLAFPNSSISPQLSAPQTTAHRVITMMSKSSWPLARPLLGSSNSAKCSAMGIIPSAKSTSLHLHPTLPFILSLLLSPIQNAIALGRGDPVLKLMRPQYPAPTLGLSRRQQTPVMALSTARELKGSKPRR